MEWCAVLIILRDAAEDVVAGEGEVARGGERRGSVGGVSGD